MKTISISKSDFQIIITSYIDLYLRRINISWDGYGGLEFDFDPPLLEDFVKEELIEILTELMSELGMIWNIEMEFCKVNENEIEFNYVEVRNVSHYEDDFEGQIDISTPKLNQHISEMYGINLDETEYQICFNIDGNSKGEYSLNNFTISATTDEGDIEIDDSITQDLAGEKLHNLMLSFGPNDSEFEYECDMDWQSPVLTIRLATSSFKLTIAE